MNGNTVEKSRGLTNAATETIIADPCLAVMFRVTSLIINQMTRRNAMYDMIREDESHITHWSMAADRTPQPHILCWNRLIFVISFLSKLC